MFEKSVGAMIAAIEIYNKPSFSYREETFSILAINAWELLFKARILQLDGKNRISSILVYERRTNADGSLSKKVYRKKSRSGNHASISLFKAHHYLVSDYGDYIEPSVIKNLEALTEIRDNSIHFLNKSFRLKKNVHELGTANLKNYLHFSRQWFGETLSDYQLFLMPIAFLQNITHADALPLNSTEKNLLKYINSTKNSIQENASDNFNFTLDVEIKLNRCSNSDGLNVKLSDSPNAVEVALSEANIREKYPWDYSNLTRRLTKRYTDFKQNKDYHSLRKKLERQEKYCNIRYLDPGNVKSIKKKYYNPNILHEFDKYYTRRKP